MDLTFIGHQSWLLSSETTHVLLDPVLGPAFGHCENVDFRVYPPRRVDVSRMPRPDAIILSHEHLDHFHLPSLDLLPRDIPFITGPLMPACVTHAVEELGFKVRAVRTGETLRVKDLALTLFSSASENVFWEKRVTQVHVRDATTEDPGVFIGVDAMVSAEYTALVRERALPSPTAIVVANNSQIPPPGAQGAYSNLLPLPTERCDPRFPGVSLLNSLLVDYVADLPRVQNIIFCGNGFVNLSEAFGPFLFSDNKKLAAIADQLSLGGRVFGPYPGEVLRVTRSGVTCSRADWIELDEPLLRELQQRQAAFVAEPSPTSFEPLLGPISGPEHAAATLAVVREELPRLAQGLIRAPVGLLALSMNEYLSGPLGPRRLLLRLREAPGGAVHQYALDLTDCSFHEDATPERDVLDVFPFGLELYLADFAGLLEGRLQIWDLAGNAMRSWFVGSIYQNVIAFLYEFYGEQTRPDLAAKVYAGALRRLQRA